MRGLGWLRSPPRERGLDDHVPRRSGSREVPKHRAEPQGHLRRDRPRRALDQALTPLHVHLQGQGPPRLASDPRVGEETTMDDTEANVASAPLPTDKTLRARKNLIIQLQRFAAINLK